MIASHYVSNPLLIDQLKFDLRIYVVVTSINPMRIYVYEDGLTRFATTKYEAPKNNGANEDLNKMKGKFCHLTNYSLNKYNKQGFKQNESESDD